MKGRPGLKEEEMLDNIGSHKRQGNVKNVKLKKAGKRRAA